MRTTTRTLHVVAGLIAASIFLPAAARAQEPAALEQSAQTLMQSTDGWGTAIKLLHRAASQRGPAEPEGVSDLVLAGRLSEYRRNHEQAREYFTEAGNRALNMGDVQNAADGFILAAFVAQSQADIEGARELVQRARMLSASPLLPEKVRDQIVRRVGSPVQVASRQR